MDQEFYFEETSPKKAIFITIIIIGIIAAFFIFLSNYQKKYTLNIIGTVTYEVGSEISYDIKKYVNNKIVDENDYSIYFTEVPMQDNKLIKAGTYNYKIKYKNVIKKGKIIVADTTPPDVEVENLTIGVNEEIALDDFVTKCDDYSKPCGVTLKNESDKEKAKSEGEYTITIVVSDSENNKVEKDVKLTVKKNYSREKTIISDLKVDHINPEFDDWKNEMVIKYSKAYDPNDIDDTEAYTELMEVTSGDLHKYLSSTYQNNLITDSQIIEVYNKYGYIIGYAIRVKLDNGLYFYLEKQN